MFSKQSAPYYNNWVKCSEGIVECGRVAAEIVKHVSEEWYNTNIEPNEGDYKCRGKPACNPKLKNNGEPDTKCYCNPCKKWIGDDDALLGAIPELRAEQPQGQKKYRASWFLVKSKDWFGNVIEVMKLFGLKNIQDAELAAITEFHHFDTAWLLSMMEKVNLFHKGDDGMEVQSQVRKATEMRNIIMHRPVGNKMPDDEMKKIFESYTMLLECFNKHFPSVVSDQDVKDGQARLDEIRDMPCVSNEMVQRAVTEFLKEVETWKNEQGADIKEIQESLQAVEEICMKVDGLKVQLEAVQKHQKDLTERVGKLEKEGKTREEKLGDHDERLVKLEAKTESTVVRVDNLGNKVQGLMRRDNCNQGRPNMGGYNNPNSGGSFGGLPQQQDYYNRRGASPSGSAPRDVGEADDCCKKRKCLKTISYEVKQSCQRSTASESISYASLFIQPHTEGPPDKRQHFIYKIPGQEASDDETVVCQKAFREIFGLKSHELQRAQGAALRSREEAKWNLARDRAADRAQIDQAHQNDQLSDNMREPSMSDPGSDHDMHANEITRTNPYI